MTPALCYLCAIMRAYLTTLRILSLLGLSLLASSALAQDLYTGEVPVARDEASSPAVLLQALDQVLVRLTGWVDESPVARLGLRQADLAALLQSQQRIERERLLSDGSVERQVVLRAVFHAAAVDRLLDARGASRWGRERPTILLWAVAEPRSGEPSVRLDDFLEAEIQAQGQRYGIDLLRPLGDALDMAEVSLADVRGGFLDAAEANAGRYGAAVVAMLDLREAGDHWTARWHWRVEGRDRSFSQSADKPEELIGPGVRGLFAQLAERFAVQAGAESRSSRRVQVLGLDDPRQYAEVMGYLSGLSPVESLVLIAADADGLVLRLELAGPGLDDILALSRVVSVESRAADGSVRLRLRR